VVRAREDGQKEEEAKWQQQQQQQPAVVREKGKGTRSQDGKWWPGKWGAFQQTAANSHANCARKKRSPKKIASPK